MLTSNSPSIIVNIAPVYDESSPGTLDRLAQLEMAMSVLTDKTAELTAKFDDFLTTVTAKIDELKALAQDNPEVIAALQALEDKLDAAKAALMSDGGVTT